MLLDSRRIWAGWLLIEELDATGTPALEKQYTWGLDLSGTLRAANLPVGMPPQAGAGGIGGLLAVEDSTGTTEEYVYFYDGNGTVTELVDSTNSTALVVAHYEYTPYGSVYSSAGTYADANTFRFSTKQFDAGTDLYYYGQPPAGRCVRPGAAAGAFTSHRSTRQSTAARSSTPARPNAG